MTAANGCCGADALSVKQELATIGGTNDAAAALEICVERTDCICTSYSHGDGKCKRV